MEREPFDPDRLVARHQYPDSGLDAETERVGHEVIGAAIEVHRHLGPGFGESVYEEALCIELRLRAISFEQQTPVTVRYKGEHVGHGRADLVVEDRVVVEFKAVETLLPVHDAQAVAYLRALSRRLALVINFNVRLLKDGVRRIIL